MAEWLKARASKACIPYGYRGFESLSLRQYFLTPFIRVRRFGPNYTPRPSKAVQRQPIIERSSLTKLPRKTVRTPD